jgi:hypothetical protein
MKRRPVSERAVDEVSLLRRRSRIDVDFQRDQQRCGSFRVGAENRLAADDDEIIFFRDLRGRCEDMINVASTHRIIGSRR